MANKICLICSKNFPGSKQVLEHLSGILKGVRECDLKILESFFRKPNLQGIPLAEGAENIIIRNLPPVRISELLIYRDNIIFAGWDYRYDKILSALNRHNITPSLIMCSTLGQSELTSHELPLLRKIYEHLKSKRLKSVLLNKRLFSSISRIFPNAFYFPHPIDINKFHSILPKKMEGINIDLFCALRPGKNVLNQILAFELSGINGLLHINFSSPQLDEVINLITKNVIRHNWMSQNEYYSLIAGMTLSLQVTFTESFSYAVCERMCLGVPVITSYDIDLISEDSFLSSYLCVNALDTPAVIGGKLRQITNDKKLRTELSHQCRQRIEMIAKKDNEYVIDFITKHFK